MHQQVSSLNLRKEVIKDLNNAGYHYVKDLKEKFKENPANALLQKIALAAAQKVPKTLTAFDCYEEESVPGAIWTFSEELDGMLGGGVVLRQITEFCGERSSGKSHICYLLCASVQLPSWCKGMEGEAVYICTNHRFASQRLKDIATLCVNKYETMKMLLSKGENSSKYTVESIMRNIHCLNIHSHTQLMAAIKHLEFFLKTHTKVRIVVIDSIVAPFRLLRGKERTEILYSMLRSLQVLSKDYNFAIVLTNDMTTGAVSLNTYAQIPALGASYCHRINTRVHLSKSQGCVRAKLIKSPSEPPQEVTFKLPC